MAELQTERNAASSAGGLPNDYRDGHSEVEYERTEAKEI